jgi:hypothetical protein
LLRKKPRATIQNIAWLEGSWKCDNDWGTSEASWTSPAGGSMACIYRLVAKGKPVFYEFVIISEFNETLVCKIKHFNPDMTGWEEKGQAVDFPLLKISDDEVVFNGAAVKKKLYYRRRADGSITAGLESETKEGKKELTEFHFQKSK